MYRQWGVGQSIKFTTNNEIQNGKFLAARPKGRRFRAAGGVRDAAEQGSPPPASEPAARGRAGGAAATKRGEDRARRRRREPGRWTLSAAREAAREGQARSLPRGRAADTVQTGSGFLQVRTGRATGIGDLSEVLNLWPRHHVLYRQWGVGQILKFTTNNEMNKFRMKNICRRRPARGPRFFFHSLLSEGFPLFSFHDPPKEGVLSQL